MCVYLRLSWKPSGKGKRLPEVYCIVSRLGCFNLFSKVRGEREGICAVGQEGPQSEVNTRRMGIREADGWRKGLKWRWQGKCMLIPEPSKNTVKRKARLSAVALFLQQNDQNTSTERLKSGVLTPRVVVTLQFVSLPLTSLELGFSCWRKLRVFNCTFYLLPYDSRLHIDAGLRREHQCWCTSFLVLPPSSWFTCFCVFML